MTQIVWAAPGSRRYEVGVDRGVLYVEDQAGIPWDGLVSVNIKPVGGEPTPYYLDGVKYLTTVGAEHTEGTIEAFVSPRAFDACDGTLEVDRGLFLTQQKRKSFSFAYRTGLGNDLEDLEYGYRIHLVYNALAKPSPRRYGTLTQNTEIPTLTWDFTTTPVSNGRRFRPTAHVILDSTRVKASTMRVIESILYGTAEESPRLMTVAQLLQMFPELTIVDNGDGTWTATGSPEAIRMVDGDTFEITAETIEYLDDSTYTIRSTSDY